MKLNYLLLIALTSTAYGAPKRTHVTGSLFNHPFETMPTTATISYHPSRSITVPGASVDATVITTTVDPQKLDLWLIPNQKATPRNTNYIVDIHTDLGDYQQEWTVPDSAKAIEIENMITVVDRTPDPPFRLKPRKPPLNPEPGRIYLDDTDWLIHVWNGSKWIP